MGSNNSRIDKLKQEQENTQKEFNKQRKIIENKRHKLQEKIFELDKQWSRIYSLSRTKHYEYEHKIQKLCDHKKYPVRKSANLRDDASFNYWLYCSNCNADLGHE